MPALPYTESKSLMYPSSEGQAWGPEYEDTSAMNKKIIAITAGAVLIVGLAGAGIGLAVADVNDNDTLSGDTLERASNAALAEVGRGTVTSAERSDDGGPAYNVEVRLDNGDDVDVELNDAFDVVYVGDLDQTGSGAAGSDAPVSTPKPVIPMQPSTEQAAADQARAEAAAVAAVGSGAVTEYDRSDDADHLYEVEVTLADGRDVDVELDASFRITTIDDAVQ